jgi:hypothetical protein
VRKGKVLKGTTRICMVENIDDLKSPRQRRHPADREPRALADLAENARPKALTPLRVDKQEVRRTRAKAKERRKAKKLRLHRLHNNSDLEMRRTASDFSQAVLRTSQM